MKVYVIKLQNNPTENIEGSLYWSNEDGWVELDDATTFSEQDSKTVQLPMEGGWAIRYRRYSVQKKDAIETILIDMWGRIGIDIPSNYEDITQYCYEDVCDAADYEHWHDGDVAIAFRRWIENQDK